MSEINEIEEQAASWLLRREEPGWSVTDQDALDAWLAQSMAHKAAFWRLEHGWRTTDRLVALGSAARQRAGTRSAHVASRRLLALAASLLLLVGAMAVLILSGDGFGNRPAQIAETRFATPVGGHRALMLADGSRVELNTATAVRAAMSEDRREVWLDSGEAYFEVAHAADRPFVVHAGPRRIVVLGTKFSVRRDGDKVTVAVAEGRVRIDPAGPEPAERSAIIAAGDIAIARGAETLVAANVTRRVAANLSWRRGVLTFDGATLREVAAEFNRYNQQQVVVSDPEIAAIRIGGSFRAANVEAFVRLLRDAYRLHVEENGEEVTISG